jgi:aryl-alcohol dehydrogenase-like predicted oxidoreductase
LDQVEILLLGWFNRYPSRRIIDSCLKLKQEGKIRFIGVSGHNRRFHGELLGRADSPFDLQMFRYNAAHRGAEQDILPFVPAVYVPGLLAYTATRWGALLREKKMPLGERPLSASDCYRFVLSNPAMDICMTGPANADQLAEAVQTLDLGPLSPAEMDRVRRIGDHVHGKSRLFI